MRVVTIRAFRGAGDSASVTDGPRHTTDPFSVQRSMSSTVRRRRPLRGAQGARQTLPRARGGEAVHVIALKRPVVRRQPGDQERYARGIGNDSLRTVERFEAVIAARLEIRRAGNPLAVTAVEAGTLAQSLTAFDRDDLLPGGNGFARRPGPPGRARRRQQVLTGQQCRDEGSKQGNGFHLKRP